MLTTGLDAAGGRGGWCCWRAWHRQGPTSGAPAALRRDMGAGAADIAQVVPAVRDNLPDLPALQGGSWRDDRQVINGIIWRTRAGAPWRDLPERRTPCQTCYVGSNILGKLGVRGRVKAATIAHRLGIMKPGSCPLVSTPEIPQRTRVPCDDDQGDEQAAGRAAGVGLQLWTGPDALGARPGSPTAEDGPGHVAFLSWPLVPMVVRRLSSRRGSRHGPPDDAAIRDPTRLRSRSRLGRTRPGGPRQPKAVGCRLARARPPRWRATGGRRRRAWTGGS